MVLEFVADPNVPPLPPHISLEQATAYLGSIVKADPDKWSMLKSTIQQVKESVLPIA